MCVSPASKLLLPLSLLMTFLFVLNLLPALWLEETFLYLWVTISPPSCVSEFSLPFPSPSEGASAHWVQNLWNLIANYARHNINLAVMYSRCKWRRQTAVQTLYYYRSMCIHLVAWYSNIGQRSHAAPCIRRLLISWSNQFSHCTAASTRLMQESQLMNRNDTDKNRTVMKACRKKHLLS